jgi:hypothetical protein
LFYLMGHFSCVMVLPELFLRESGNTPVSIDKFINDVNWLDTSDFFDTIFNPFLCAFRRGHGCQTTLLRLLEDWREALDTYYVSKKSDNCVSNTF